MASDGKKHLVGEQAILLKPFYGGAKPHGRILEIYHHELIVGKHKGFLVLKRNYNGKGISVDTVSHKRKNILVRLLLCISAKLVMMRRI